ncbi:MAG TPA: hypothetical protein VNS32_19725 [Flavisolibacter sp.]|nr:hypothetical protein [Flavisolibacter sp.]
MEYKISVPFEDGLAGYKVVTLNQKDFKAELVSFSGIEERTPPHLIAFALESSALIANADFIGLAEEIAHAKDMDLQPTGIH